MILGYPFVLFNKYFIGKRYPKLIISSALLTKHNKKNIMSIKIFTNIV